MFSFFKRRRRRKLLARPEPRTWGPWLADLPFFANLNTNEQERLARITRVLVAEKNWQGADGLEVTEKIKVQIAAQAALLILNIEHDHYRRTKSIVIYPSTFQVPDSSDGGRVPTLGQAHEWGTVVLSWNAARGGVVNPEDGQNVVLHEFAHRLDMLDHHTDGTPPLGS
ncbi:MAG: zinc-dependent peptidase, partial [Phycisphaerae bacterium]|nr:zinc-dependent peptidase [Phycisphaerae bacterium]